MKQASPKEIEAVLKLDGPARFAHFVKRVVDEERAWSLWDDGWALMVEDAGTEVLPLWPAREYAERCKHEDWSRYEPREVKLSEILDDLLPSLSDAGLRVGVFPTPGGKGVTVAVGELEAALRVEMDRY
jgi:hypothetical protein